MKSDRITLFENEDFKIELEFNKDFAILHFPFDKPFTPSILKRVKKAVEDLTSLLTCIGYDSVWTGAYLEDRVANKLAKSCGFVFKGKDNDLNLYERFK